MPAQFGLWQLGIILALAGALILLTARLRRSDGQKRDTVAAGIVLSLAGCLSVLISAINLAA